MLLFSTTLNTTERLNKESFIKLIRKTIQENPFEENVIPNIDWHGEKSASYGDENLSLKIEDYRAGNTIAARYEKKAEDGAIWDTEYVFNAKDKKVSIRLERSYSEEALKQSEIYSAPYFIKNLIEAGGVEKDGALEISYRPLFVNEENQSIVDELRQGKSLFRLPVVLVSAINHKEDLGDIFYLAHYLKGAAHVLFENETKLEDVDGEEKPVSSACNIDIFYPNNAINSLHISHKRGIITDDLRLRLANEVMKYTNSQLVEESLTWAGVNAAITTETMARMHGEMAKKEDAKKAAEEEAQQIKESMDEEVAKHKEEAVKEATAEADKMLEAFEDDWAKMEKRIKELEEEINRLTTENWGLLVKVNSQEGAPIIYEGEEKELYPGEMKEIVLYFLEEAYNKGIAEGSRISDVLKDIFQRNEFSRKCKRDRELIDKYITTYNRMDAPTRKALEDIGFEITEDGKHYKLKYYGDARYHDTLSKTPSDTGHGNKNAASGLKKVLG